MGKAIGSVLLIAAAIAVNVIPGAGQAASAALFGLASAAAITSAVTLAAIGAGIGLASSLIGGSPKVPAATLSRLTLSFDPNTPRKIVFGYGPMGTDVLYVEPSGTNQEYVDYIICCAAHEVTSFETIYSDSAVMWTSAGGVQGIYVGFLTVDTRLVGTSSNGIAINGGSTWTSACTLTGCAYIHLRIKRTGNGSAKADSPFAGGLSSSMRIVGKGMRMYDPRRDSTNGGSGAHRPADQTTWEYTSGGVELGQNHALHALAVKLGWAINSVTSVGAGMPVARIDLSDYITAANICDEAVTLAAGGTQRRYEGGGMFQDTDTPGTMLDSLCAHMDATIRDVSGKLGIYVKHNDLSGALPAFTINDVLGAHTWNQYPSLSATPSEVRGKFSDPSTASLWQLAPYTTESVTPPDGVRRPFPLDLPLCHDATRAQRIARQKLRGFLYAGVFTADFGPRMWGLGVYQPMTLDFLPAGLATQKFRLDTQQLKIILDDAGAVAFCPATLIAQDPYIFAWDGIVTLPGAAVPMVAYNPSNNPLATKQGSDIGVENGADVTAVHAPDLAVSAGVTVNADYTGALLVGQVPIYLQGVRKRGNTDVSATSTWTAVGTGCTVSISSGGLLTISAVTGTGRVSWTAASDGVTLAAETVITKAVAAAPTSGGTGGTSVSASVSSFNSASYGAAQTGIMTVMTGSGGALNLTAPLSFNGSGDVLGKWQWRAISGTFADVAAEIADINPASPAAGGEPASPGYIEVTQTKSGLSATTNYEVQLLMRRSAAGGSITTSTLANARGS
jgi:hypothetical protein